MSVLEKYELIQPADDVAGLARHRRLGRLVNLQVFSATAPQGSQVRQVASRMADLDHPVIPHLVDVIESGESLYLATETQADQQHAGHEELLDRLAAIGQVSDALAHAHQRNVAHGRLSQECIRFDAIGNPRLIGLGILQCEQAGEKAMELAELEAKDLTELRAIVRGTVRRRTDASEGETELEFAELNRLLAEPYANVSEWHPSFQAWLQRQQSLREARRLAVSDVQVEQEDRSPLMSSLGVAIATGFVLLVAIGVLSALLWPGTAESIGREDVAAASDAVRIRNDEVSSLENVGVVNNSELTKDAGETLDAPSRGQVPSAQLPGNETSTADSNEPEDFVASVEDNIASGVNKSPEPEESDSGITEPQNGEPTEKVVAASSDPLATLPADAELPPVSQSEVFEIGATNLDAAQNVELSLRGGRGAYKEGEFRLRDKSNGNWIAEYRSKKQRAEVAAFGIANSRIRFRWLSAASAEEFASHLRNTKLCVSVGSVVHDIALRKPKKLSAVRFALEGTRQITLELDAPPAWSEVVVELVEDDKSLVRAIPKSEMPAVGGEMMVGLDSGKKSLLMVQIESLARGRLRTTGWFRPSVSTKRRKVRKGFERNLRKANSNLNQQLFKMKTAVSMIKGKGTADTKKAMQAQVKRLEGNVENAEKFWEAFMAAKLTEVDLRVYRQLGEDKFMLMEFVDSETN